jgi:hypothetical protein
MHQVVQFLLIRFPNKGRFAPAKEVVQYQGDAHEFRQQAVDWTRTQQKLD